jgi:phospholipid/cholesterol/gamma-HCH transport system substrate-binding protein
MSDSRSEQKEQERFWNEFRVGVLAVVAIALLVLGVRFLQGVPLLGDTYPLVAQFENAGGVAEGTPVTVRGISVGTVEDVALSEGEGVEVRMHIEEDVRLPEGTTASVSGVSALDDVRISLDRGPGGAPLASGSEIPTRHTGVLETLRGQAVPLTRKVDSLLTEATGTFSEAGRVLGRSEPEVENTLRNLESASSSIDGLLRRERDRLHRTMVHLERTSASLDTLVSDLQHITSTEQDTLERTVEDAERTFHHARRAARSLDRSTEALNKILTDLEAGKGTAGRLLTDPRLYRRLHSVSVRADSILADFQRRPGRYLQTNIELF